jgi:hypothetical protein
MGEVQALLAAFITGIYAGAPCAVEARKISQALVGSAWSSERGKPVTGGRDTASADGDLELVLARIKIAAKMPGIVKVENGKTWLRQHGERGAKAASLLSKLSGGRNLQCHKVAAQLIAEVDLIAADSSRELVAPVSPTASMVGFCEVYDIASQDALAGERKEMWADIIDSSCGSGGEVEVSSFDEKASKRECKWARDPSFVDSGEKCEVLGFQWLPKPIFEVDFQEIRDKKEEDVVPDVENPATSSDGDETLEDPIAEAFTESLVDVFVDGTNKREHLKSLLLRFVRGRVAHGYDRAAAVQEGMDITRSVMALLKDGS